MTYNFDPDKWFDNELAFLESRFKSGEISRRTFEEERDKIDRRYESMVNRLDGSYRVASG
ncbi:MAG: hypothetical protein GY859_21655 [Desulfobacterales bacterium]|nr:hypothetical protein [Desulfobacterales bacterium]